MYRSFLFVPGDRPERFEKAVASGADAVCIDLEDAVAAANKDDARKATFAYLASPLARRVAVGVRLNAFDRIEGYRDMAALGESGARPSFVLLPKVRGAQIVGEVRAALGDKGPAIWALMETPEALASIGALACAIGEGGGIVFGGADLSAALGSDMSWDALLHARGALVAAAALAGCQTLDVPYLNVRDVAGLKAETARIKAMGFTGRSCIHPDQVGPINEVFTPSSDEIETAKAVIAAYENNSGRVLLHEGRLVEKPVLAAARRTLARERS